MRHAGELAVQRRAGLDLDGWGSAGAGPEIPAVAAEFLARQRMLVVGAADDAGAVWAGALAGPAGFVRARGDREVVVDAVPEAGPLAGVFAPGADRDVGMLAIEPATRRRMRVNGTARRSGGGLAVRTEQVYANCPKYIQTRTVDAEEPPAGPVEASGSDRLSAAQRAWIAAADTFFVATRADGLGADASHRGGNPGFVAVGDDRTLVWPEYAGNSMYMTLGNLELDPRCGLLFLDWERGRALHLTGTARTDWDPGRAAAVPGAQRLVAFALDRVVEVGGALPLRWTFERYSKFNPV
ncbi:pyridoxamine 5'-phosphate oxidase family protein [Glycomyces terrestris]|uniref:Oxidoreductase n=1 Tax=Glycomyces terrestris TaxID=2493553 RepID=A0A426UVW6_9ACTN|nr:pyridoxamine 5'-phosphate oxidase family protein [Glycomyces terrestris]RRR98403.1 oxidoreductase [Glycomyces terrestris]